MKRVAPLLLLVAAAVCFLVALLIAGQTIITHGNYPAWVAAGLFGVALALAVERIP